MVRELVLWKSGVPIFQPSGGKGREQISAKAMSSSWTKNESSYNQAPFPFHRIYGTTMKEVVLLFVNLL